MVIWTWCMVHTILMCFMWFIFDWWIRSRLSCTLKCKFCSYAEVAENRYSNLWEHCFMFGRLNCDLHTKTTCTYQMKFLCCCLVWWHCEAWHWTRTFVFSLLLSECVHIQFTLFLKTNSSSVQPVSFRRIINPFAVLL